MLSLLWTIPALPLAGFLALILMGEHIARREITRIGVGSIGLSAAMALLIAFQFLTAPPESFAYRQELWTWINTGSFTVEMAFRLDALSLLMVLVVTVIGFLIHVYSTEYMADDASFARFFAYMNLFVAAMLILVLADNLLFLFVGWEGVGLCSYLLIGFWYEDPKNGQAAVKAFIVTRIGDAAMLVGMLLLFWQFGTLDIAAISQGLTANAASQGAAPHFNPQMISLAAALLLGGAVGKSGQLPLQVWLPDAMAGPTPVSALIHAATMVTAGVYLIARMHTVFEQAPGVQHAVALIGVITLLLAGCCALVQRDIKRVLAYSTISQIGYMFLALGVGAWTAAMFHFFTHAIFKALLFMAAGAIIIALHHEQDMFKMGGLHRRLPLVFWTFLVGAMSLTALPLFTAGFYSKDFILYDVFTSNQGGLWLWAGGVIGAFITALYSFRMLILVFFGDAKTAVHHGPGLAMSLPLLLLAVGATVAGFIELPPVLGDLTLFSHFVEHTLPGTVGDHTSKQVDLLLMATSTVAELMGIALGYLLWCAKGDLLTRLAHANWGRLLHRLLGAGWGFDWLYERLIVRPYAAGARVNANDLVNVAYSGLVRGAEAGAYLVRQTQTGNLRWYMAGTAIGAIVGIFLVAYL